MGMTWIVENILQFEFYIIRLHQVLPFWRGLPGLLWTLDLQPCVPCMGDKRRRMLCLWSWMMRVGTISIFKYGDSAPMARILWLWPWVRPCVLKKRHTSKFCMPGWNPTTSWESRRYVDTQLARWECNPRNCLYLKIPGKQYSWNRSFWLADLRFIAFMVTEECRVINNRSVSSDGVVILSVRLSYSWWSILNFVLS